ncbi:MAG: 30S ribosomal protein S8 [Planctomycetota bacterium]
MSFNDPIADMLTRIRNAARNRAKEVKCLNSKVCRGVAEVLKQEGYINNYEVLPEEQRGQGLIRVMLKYGPRGETVLHTIKRESRPGCRIYKKVDELEPPLDGLGISVVSTSQGVLSDRQCRDRKVGGELLATVD